MRQCGCDGTACIYMMLVRPVINLKCWRCVQRYHPSHSFLVFHPRLEACACLLFDRAYTQTEVLNAHAVLKDESRVRSRQQRTRLSRDVHQCSKERQCAQRLFDYSGVCRAHVTTDQTVPAHINLDLNVWLCARTRGREGQPMLYLCRRNIGVLHY